MREVVVRIVPTTKTYLQALTAAETSAMLGLHSSRPL